MTEMESLSPLMLLGPKEKVEHNEQWELFSDVKPPKNEEEMDKIARKHIT